MKLFLDHADHSRFLFDRASEKPDRVLISSFGIYAGISFSGQDTTTWGEKYRLATRDLLEIMRTLPDVKMLIGVADYRSCKYNAYCRDCETTYAKNLLRLAFHAELFPEFEWRVSTQLHLKCALFYYGDVIKGVAGGRNLTDSNWADVTIELSPGYAAELAQHTMQLWAASAVLNDDAISEILKSQNISDKTMTAIANQADR